MKKALITLLAVLALATPAFAQGQHYVQPCTRSNGSYVQGHYQTNPDHSFGNNWSTRGNVNPYTGQEGYRTQPSNRFIYNSGSSQWGY
ncbi:MAG: hypothetical protein NT105_09525 [Verrucomicrobia bacterium]|nr:hypothetical protein [Verrucomicrobiota bacterium]